CGVEGGEGGRGLHGGLMPGAGSGRIRSRGKRARGVNAADAPGLFRSPPRSGRSEAGEGPSPVPGAGRGRGGPRAGAGAATGGCRAERRPGGAPLAGSRGPAHRGRGTLAVAAAGAAGRAGARGAVPAGASTHRGVTSLSYGGSAVRDGKSTASRPERRARCGGRSTAGARRLRVVLARRPFHPDHGDMAITHARLIALPVVDQDRAKDFYVGVLGFAVLADHTMGRVRWLHVAPPGAGTGFVLTVLEQGF